MGEMIVSALQRYPDRTAFLQDGRATSYRQLAGKISQAVQLFQSLGLKRGDIVAQLSGNRPEVYAVVAAAYVAGLTSTTLHAMGSLRDHAFIVQDAGAKLFVVDRVHAHRATEIRASAQPGIHWFCHEEQAELESFWAAAERFPAKALAPVGHFEDVIRLAYTGGTTGDPKGVMLSNRSLTTNTLLALAGHEWPEELRFLCPTPISHGAGSLILPTLWKGGTVILQSGFSAEKVLDAIEQDGANFVFLVPTMIYALLDHPRARATNYSRLHSLFYGAAPMAPARIREALELFGPVLVQGYGQTESPNTILTLTRADHLAEDPGRLASAGKPYPGIHVRLLDDNGDEVEPGGVGELCVRGPLVMSGYWKQPELTAEAFRGGWLHTGDMALQDEQGFYYLVDRKKDLIISGGFNVYPGEVEKLLTEHPAVAAAAVIGVPDPRWGEAVKAVVVLRDGAEASESALIGHVREGKGPVCAPKSVDFVDALPVTALGKLDKKALRARYWSGSARGIN